MLAVARAIVEPRELLLVDEPSKGLAPSIINNLIDALRQLKAHNTTIQRARRSESRSSAAKEDRTRRSYASCSSGASRGSSRRERCTSS